MNVLVRLCQIGELSKRVIEGCGACSFFDFGLLKADSAGSRIDAFFRAFLGLAVSSALVAAASLSASDSDFYLGRNLDRSRNSLVKELLLKLMRLLMQIRLIYSTSCFSCDFRPSDPSL